MPYIKLLTVLAGLALLTACAGAVTVNPTVNTGGNGGSGGGDGPCVTNPFGTTCTNPTETQELVFCRDDTRTTDTKTDDCAPTITRVCTANVFDTLCTAPTKEQAEVFCGDVTKTTTTKPADCAQTITDACTDDFFHTLCTAEVYVQQRKDFNDMCINQAGKTPQICEAEAQVRTCDADEFATGCVAQKYVDERRMTCLTAKTTTRCMPTVELICGTNGDIFDDFCTGLTDTDTMRASACQTHGTDPTDGHSTCATILIPLCGIADPFAHEGCDDVVGINAGVRKTFCETPATAWDPKCMETTHGAVNATRVMACQMFGIDTGTGGDTSCADSLASSCTITDPFAYTGCKDVAEIAGVRMMYCQAPATAWDEECMETIHGTVDATRVTACQMFGTDTDTGGHATCATSLATVCNDIANPFIYDGCDDVAGIDAGVRTMYCTMPANAFKTGCKTDGTHDVLTQNGATVNGARRDACLFSPVGTPADPSCETDSLTEQGCELDPFSVTNTGCRNLMRFSEIVGNFCDMNQSNQNCGVKTSTWVENARNADDTADLEVRGVRAALANDAQYTLITGGTESLELGDAVAKHATNFGDLTFKNTEVPANGTFVGETAFTGNPNVAGGISYATNVGATKLYAGLLSDTNVGALLEATPTANWLGRLAIIHGENITTNAFHDVADFQLVIDFTNTALSQTVALSNRESAFYQQFIIAGKFNDKGVIFGTATYELRNTSNDVLSSRGIGILTGLIGQKGAAAVFHKTGGTENGLTDFIGGFVAVPYVPEADDFPNKATFSDWVRDFGPNPPPATLTATTPATARQREFLAGGTAGLDTTDAVSIISGANLTLTLGATGPNSARYNGEPLGGDGDASDGYGLLIDTVATNSFVVYAGLLADTDLGAPLTQTNGSVTWYGQIQIFRHGTFDTIDPHNFELEITYGGTNGVAGSIEGDVERVLSGSTRQYRLAGTYDAGGVITGTTTYAGFMGDDTGQLNTAIANGTGQGILTGLIGAQGAVGVFLRAEAGSTKDNIEGAASASQIYAGGFVVAPPVPSVATYANFKTYYADSARTDERTLYATPTSTDSRGAFVEGTATGLPTDGFTFTSGNFAPVTVRLKKAVSGNDGFVLMYGNVSSGLDTRRFRAGLLPTTDLGPAVPTTSTATWAGSLHLGLAGGGVRNVDLPTVTVDFANGRITAPETEVGVGTGNTVTINGLFGAGLPSGTPAGILGGTVNFDFSGNPHTDRPLIGLIGTKGAIGIFHGDGLTLIGGFQASPN